MVKEALKSLAEEIGIKMCIYPDDPPFPILGLPRVVSTEQDLADLVNAAPSPSNGLTTIPFRTNISETSF